MDDRREATRFLLRRAEQEAIRAIAAGHPDVAAAHFDLSLRYGERARDVLTGNSPPDALPEVKMPRPT